MKIAYKHLLKYLKSKPDIDDVSSRLFQLGHEHEISNGIFDIEFTPNRGDCLSLRGLARDLNPFFGMNNNISLFEGELGDLKLNFKNNAKKECPKISFLKVEVENINQSYTDYLDSYYDDMQVKKNNFFTDISNYLSYETGQPTHCYDVSKLSNEIYLDICSKEKNFMTLLGNEISLKEENLVFLQDNKIINLAGIIGGEATACSARTSTVLIECAYFNPEVILGKTTKYDIQSEAAYKFERGVDPDCHEYVLRRFLKIIEENAKIKKAELYVDNCLTRSTTKISYELNRIENILGMNISYEFFKDSLEKLAFIVNENEILVPSHRSDIYHQNDIAEEIARLVGYNNIPKKNFDLSHMHDKKFEFAKEDFLKEILISYGFNEVVNYPFTDQRDDNVIEVDNPLDSSKKYLRTNLKKSLLNNLLFNERRQKDSIKLFEVSDIYHTDPKKNKRVIGIIASGRIGKNYKQFSKQIDNKYIKSILETEILSFSNEVIEIPRHELDTKLKNHISYIEFDLDENIEFKNVKDKCKLNLDMIFKKYEPISEYPVSIRDLSFSVKDISIFKKFEKRIQNYKHDILKEVFVFDFYKNEKFEEIKIGFRFIFQSKDKTITDSEVNIVIEDIINITKSYDKISIPGFALN